MSDDASSQFLRWWESQLVITGTTATITKCIRCYWDDFSQHPVVSQATGTITISRIDGVKIGHVENDEIVDARVGANGTTYPTLGDAIRGQITDLESDISSSIYIEDTAEQIGTPEQGYWSNGSFTPSTSYLSRKISVGDAKRVRIVGNVSQWYDIYVFLDEEENVLSYLRKTDSTPTDITVDVPQNAVYVCVSSGTTPAFESIKVYFSYSVNVVLPEKIEQIDENTTNIVALNSMSIEGYNKEQYRDITFSGTTTDGKYAQITNNAIDIANNNSYRYCVLDVEAGDIYRTTGLYAFDMYPAMYTDDNGSILYKYPASRSPSPQTITVETTVPNGATKLYVSAYLTGTLTIEKKGVYYNKEDDSNKIDVQINTDQVLDTTVITYRENTFRHKLGVFNASDQPNHAVLPRSVEVYMGDAWKTIVNNEDDNCPVNLSSGYLGAGHGYDRARKVTAVNHGKTYEDIGSEWLAGDDRPWNHAWLVRVVDADTLIFMGRNASNDYDTDSVAGTTLTHVNGAVHTDTINGSENVQYLLAPVDKNHVKRILLDGETEVSENGEYKAQKFVDIVEEYDIVNPQTIVSEILANKPAGGYTENPPINTGSTFLHFSNVYRILSDGTMILFSTLDNSVPVTLGYWGGTQYAQKSPANAFGGALFRYVPKVLPIDGRDFRTPFNMANWNFTANVVTTAWENENFPPDRLLHLFTDANNKYVAGFAVGYLPIAEGDASIRKNNISNAMMLYQTQKAYFHLVDTGGVNGNAWEQYKPFQSIIYRKPIVDVANIHTDAYFIPLEEKCYLYADYHNTADDRIKVPAEYVGKPITIIEKSSNITVYGTIATDEIRIRCITADPMYGYVVIQIG